MKKKEETRFGAILLRLSNIDIKLKSGYRCFFFASFMKTLFFPIQTIITTTPTVAANMLHDSIRRFKWKIENY